MIRRPISILPLCVVCCLLFAPIADAQNNYFLRFDLPEPMDVNRAFHLLGIPVKHFEALAPLNADQKKKIIELAQRFRDDLLKKMIASVGDQAGQLMKNYLANGPEFGTDLGFLDLDDQQKTKLRVLIAEYKKADPNRLRGREKWKVQQEFSTNIQEVLTGEQMGILKKVKSAKSFYINRDNKRPLILRRNQ